MTINTPIKDNRANALPLVGALLTLPPHLKEVVIEYGLACARKAIAAQTAATHKCGTCGNVGVPVAQCARCGFDDMSPIAAQTAPQAVDSEEDAFVINKLSTILADIAITLKGDELELHRHSYHDLADLVRAVKLELDLYRANANDVVSIESLRGAEVSIDVSTGDDDSWHRIYGNVEGFAYDDNGRMLIISVEENRNFPATPQPFPAPAVQAVPVAWMDADTGKVAKSNRDLASFERVVRLVPLYAAPSQPVAGKDENMIAKLGERAGVESVAGVLEIAANYIENGHKSTILVDQLRRLVTAIDTFTDTAANAGKDAK